MPERSPNRVSRGLKMSDYTIYYKTNLPVETEWSDDEEWDLFISAFNSSERVKCVYEKVRALKKHWLIIPDYVYEPLEHPDGLVFAPPTSSEAGFILDYVKQACLDVAGKKLCIDITGFVKPYMMSFMKWLWDRGAHEVDVLYSEPVQYAKKEETKFSDEEVLVVRQVEGYEGMHVPDTRNDLLIVGAGYDHELIAHVAESKGSARKIQVFGLPSLHPDMYQENVLRAHRAAEAVGGEETLEQNRFFAPANDPFVTASVLQEIVARETKRERITNLYLCPLATKPQALGFILYYLTECQGRPVSMLYPICKTHFRQTSEGISRIWKYTLELG